MDHFDAMALIWHQLIINIKLFKTVQHPFHNFTVKYQTFKRKRRTKSKEEVSCISQKFARNFYTAFYQHASAGTFQSNKENKLSTLALLIVLGDRFWKFL